MVRGDTRHKLETEVAEPREHQASQEHGLVLAKSELKLDQNFISMFKKEHTCLLSIQPPALLNFQLSVGLRNKIIEIVRTF